MFDRHQTEISFMPFRGHSLPVHQSMSVSWAFTLSHFVSQICLCDFFRLLPIGMSHFFLEHHFGMACLEGRRSIQKSNRRTFGSVSAWKNSPNPVVCRVWMLLYLRALKILNSLEKIQLRMMCTNRSFFVTVPPMPAMKQISSYLTTSYLPLSHAFPKAIIRGDMNARIAKDEK